MSEPLDDKESADKILNSLVRLVRDNTANGFKRPLDSTINAYIDGDATESQMEEMHKALIRSRAFRQEIRDLTTDLTAIADIDYSQPLDDESDIEVPRSLVEMLDQKTRQTVDRSIQNGILHKIVSISSMRSYRLAMVAAAAIILLVVTQWPRTGIQPGNTARWSQVDESIETPRLMSNTTRNANTENSSMTYATATEAALAGCRDLLELELETGKFRLRPGFPLPTADSHVGFSLASEDGAKKLLATSIKWRHVEEPEASKGLTGWLLTLPDKRLYYTQLSTSEMDATWVWEDCHAGCFIVVSHDSLGYHSISGSYLTIE